MKATWVVWQTADISQRHYDVWETRAEIPHWWRVTTQIKVGLLIGWSNFLTNKICGPFLKNTNITFGPEKLFYVCRVCIQHYSLNNFENNTMKLSVNEEKFYSKYFSTGYDFEICLRTRKVTGAFREKGPLDSNTHVISMEFLQSLIRGHFVGNQRRRREIRLFFRRQHKKIKSFFSCDSCAGVLIGKYQGHPTSIFGKHLFGKRLEI